MEKIESIIREIPYFKQLDNKSLSRICLVTETVKLKEKEKLFQIGDVADAFYIVAEGDIKIVTVNTKHEQVVVARVTNHGFFGEQAFSHSPSPRRQASAYAVTDTILYKISRDTLNELDLEHHTFQPVVEKQNIINLKERTDKLLQSISNTSFNIESLTKSTDHYQKRQVVYFQGDPAENVYVLGSGVVELRRFDENKRNVETITVGIGHVFGREAFEDEKSYAYTAIMTESGVIIAIDKNKWTETFGNNLMIAEMTKNFDAQEVYLDKGKISRFHSEYMGMLTNSSLVSLKDGREILCQQIIGEDVLIVSTSNTKATKKIKYSENEQYYREIQIKNNKIVGLVEYGFHEDRSKMIGFVFDGTTISDEQIQEFIKTGSITEKEVTSDYDNEDIICRCMQVNAKTINQIIENSDASFEDISRQTGAGTICGGCKPVILDMLGTDVWKTCKVIEVIPHHSYVYSFRLRPMDDNIESFNPGQHLIIRARVNNVPIQRNYTLTSIPTDDYYEITIKKEEMGALSPWLFENVKVGSTLQVAGPFGDFLLENSEHFPIICFVGGIGVTPAVSFSRYIHKEKKQKPILIDYSVADRSQFILSEEFYEMEKVNKHISINMRETGRFGKITMEDIKNLLDQFSTAYVYICGPKPMEDFILDSLEKLKFPKERVFKEEFIHSGAPDDALQTINLE